MFIISSTRPTRPLHKHSFYSTFTIQSFLYVDEYRAVAMQVLVLEINLTHLQPVFLLVSTVSYLYYCQKIRKKIPAMFINMELLVMNKKELL